MQNLDKVGLDGIMDIEATAATRKSIILKPKHVGDVQVVPVKHCFPWCNWKEHDKQPTPAEVSSLRVLKRKSHVLIDNMKEKDIDEHCQSGKRRQSVKLTKTMKLTSSPARNLVRKHSSSNNERDALCMQRTDQEVETLRVKVLGTLAESMEVEPGRTHSKGPSSKDFPKTSQQHDAVNSDVQGLIPNAERSEDSGKPLRLDKQKALQFLSTLNLQEIDKSGIKYKSLFETYQLDKVEKSIVEEN